MHRYQPAEFDAYVIFPYDISRNSARLLSIEEMKMYPKTWEYLRRNELTLRNREQGKMNRDDWYAYIYPKNLKDFDRRKIMTPDISYGSNMTIDNEGKLYHTTTVYSFILKEIDQSSEFYYLALLNSRVLWAFLSRVGNILRGGYFRFKTAYLEPFPIPRISFTTLPQERASYLEKATNLYAYCLDNHDQSGVLGFVEYHLTREPEESDVVHDLLAFLAEQMIRLNKEKRAAQREFLDWLVITLKLLPDKEGRKGIDVLTGKSKLLDYPGDYQKGESPLTAADLLEMLQKNKGHLGVSLSDTTLVDRLLKVYEESLQRVLPLKEQLAKTDRLIDAVVYRLYGLTEEEIAVVEERG